jgi:hypothetical protein
MAHRNAGEADARVLPGSLMENDGLRSSSLCVSITVIRSDSVAISSSSTCNSRDLSPSSSDATISIGRLTFCR